MMHEPEPIPPTPQPTDGGASETEGWWPADAQERRRPEPFNTRKRWAHRLAFPLMAMAVLAAWQGVQVSQGEASVMPSWAWWTLAMMAALAGLLMVRERHRTPG